MSPREEVTPGLGPVLGVRSSRWGSPTAASGSAGAVMCSWGVAGSGVQCQPAPWCVFFVFFLGKSGTGSFKTIRY